MLPNHEICELPISGANASGSAFFEPGPGKSLLPYIRNVLKTVPDAFVGLSHVCFASAGADRCRARAGFTSFRVRVFFNQGSGVLDVGFLTIRVVELRVLASGSLETHFSGSLGQGMMW